MFKSKPIQFVLAPLLVFLGSFVGLALFFSQQSGHILWENLVASAIFAAILAFFAFICMFSKWIFIGWMGITILAAGIVYLAGWDSFSINYFGGNAYVGSCPVSFYCFNTEQLGFWYLLMKTAFEIIFLFDVIVGFKLGVHTLVALNWAYPQTRYFMGTFILGLFTFLLSFVQRIPDVPKYTDFQYLLLGFLGILALASFCFGVFYTKLGTKLDRFKKIYGAAVLSYIFLIPILIPFDVASAEDQRAALIARVIFASLAVFLFIYMGFFAKPASIGSKKIKKS